MKTFMKDLFLSVLFIFMITTYLTAVPINQFINSVTPDINSLNAGSSQNIIVNFLQYMDPLTLNGAGIRVSGNETGLMTTVITYNAATKTAVINPDSDFKAGEQINVNINNSVKTISNVPVEPVSYIFTVKVSRGDGNFTTETAEQNGIKPDGIISADFDGDGYLDLITISKNTQTAAFLKNNGAGLFTLDNTFIIDSLRIQSFSHSDYDNDGDIDLAFIVGSYLDYSFKILLNNGNGTFLNGFRDHIGYYGRVGSDLLKSCDINNDGYIDVLGASADRFLASITVFKNNGNAQFINGGNISQAQCEEGQIDFGEITSFELSDVNNDGNSDIIMESYKSFLNECNKIQVMSNNGSGNFSERAVYSFPLQHHIICTGDFDGDGFVDLMCSGLFMNNNGDGYFTSSPANIFANTGIAGDFDGDGDLDIAVIEGNSVKLFKNDGNALFSGPFIFNTGLVPVGICSGNFDGDCDLDIATSNNVSNNVSVLFNSSNEVHCTMSGPDLLTVNNENIQFSDPESGGYWEIINQPPCSASISSSNQNTAYVNAGPVVGTFILYHHTEDDCGWRSCSKTVSVDNPLPVELASFTAVSNRNDVTLKWTTSSEINNSGFDIERSVSNSQLPNENINWDKVGNVSGHGTVSTSNNYSYADRNLSTGKYRYRLKQIDFNGNFEYFNLSDEVVIGIPVKYELSQNYPNPFNPVTNIEYWIPEQGFVTLKVYDISGKEVRVLVNEILSPGYFEVKFDGSDLASGIYFYQLKSGDFLGVKKMMILK